MTDIFKKPMKLMTKNDLFSLGIKALEQEGWLVERVKGLGKSSVRRIVKANQSKLVSIRTSQDTWIAFPRNRKGDGWATLEDVDYVVAVSVDDKENPQFAKVHMIDGVEMRERFDRAYNARKKANHSLQDGRGVWVSLYEKEADFPVNRVGAGAGLTNPTLMRIPLREDNTNHDRSQNVIQPIHSQIPAVAENGEHNAHITIPEAKRLLAISFGINEADITISINS